MVNEVNKIIYNTLIAERAINLPGVGTISVVRRSAETASAGRVTPPTYVTEFSSHTEAISIVDIITNIGNTEKTMAEDIYNRWLEKVRTASVITIDGVGKISNKSFSAEAEFIKLFNVGNSTQPIKVVHKRGVGAFAILLIILASLTLVAGGVYWFFHDDIKAIFACDDVTNTTTKVVETPIESIATTENTPIEAVETAEVEVIVEDNDATLEPIVKVPAVVENNWFTRDDIRHWVVAGSYSTKENAEVAVQNLETQYDGIYCDIISLGKMYAVAIFGSVEREECEEFMRSHRKEFEQVWIFTPKANR